MSYLVDALKKAERERHENQRADMRSLAGGEPTGGGSGTALRWVVGVLVACNAALLIYLFLPVSAPVPFVAPPAPAPVAAPQAESATTTATPAGVERDSAVSGDAARGQSNALEARAPEQPSLRVSTGPDKASQPVAASNSAPPSTAQDASASMTLPPARRPANEDRADSSAREAGLEKPSSSGGQVTFSATPLDDDTTFMPDDLRADPVSDSPPGNAPDIAINGHLYSSVPGRSFILVRGRRYHEGERLADGPAVESIDARGATLNYQGQRYHVRGPG